MEVIVEPHGVIIERSWHVEWIAVPSYDVQPKEVCRVYWGSHGCYLPRGHKGGHWCENCCDCDKHPDPDSGCVAGPPYYGRWTWFYGEDAPRFQPLRPLWAVLHPYHMWPHRWWMAYAFWDRPRYAKLAASSSE